MGDSCIPGREEGVEVEAAASEIKRYLDRLTSLPNQGSSQPWTEGRIDGLRLALSMVERNTPNEAD